MKTIYSPYVKEVTVLGSRFIGIILPISSREDVTLKLSKIKDDYPKATHYVQAFVVHEGDEGCSDDGEPSRSCGLPLLNILRGSKLTRALLVIVRYFGGTKLGLPRLTRTYRDLGKDLVLEAPFAEIIEGEKLLLEADYSSFEEAKRLFERLLINIENAVFGTKVLFNVVGDAKIIEPLLNKMPRIDVKERKTIEILRRINK